MAERAKQTTKSEQNVRLTYRPTGIEEYLGGKDAFILLRITPEEATLPEGFVDFMDTSAADMTIQEALKQYVLGKDAAHAKKIRNGVQQDLLGAYRAAVKLLGDSKTLTHINGGALKVNLGDKVGDHLSLRETLEDGQVKDGVPLLDLILEKDNTGGYRLSYR